MIITNREYEAMQPEERITLKGVLAMNGLGLDDVRHVDIEDGQVVATVYHKIDGKKHTWTPDCPLDYRVSRNDACQYEVKLPAAA